MGRYIYISHDITRFDGFKVAKFFFFNKNVQNYNILPITYNKTHFIFKYYYLNDLNMFLLKKGYVWNRDIPQYTLTAIHKSV